MFNGSGTPVASPPGCRRGEMNLKQVICCSEIRLIGGRNNPGTHAHVHTRIKKESNLQTRLNPRFTAPCCRSRSLRRLAAHETRRLFGLQFEGVFPPHASSAASLSHSPTAFPPAAISSGLSRSHALSPAPAVLAAPAPPRCRRRRLRGKTTLHQISVCARWPAAPLAVGTPPPSLFCDRSAYVGADSRSELGRSTTP